MFVFHISTRNTCHSHQLATSHKHRPLNPRAPVLMWPASTPWRHLTSHGRRRSTSSNISITTAATTSITHHLHPHNHQQHSASTPFRKATSWHRNSAYQVPGIYIFLPSRPVVTPIAHCALPSCSVTTRPAVKKTPIMFYRAIPPRKKNTASSRREKQIHCILPSRPVAKQPFVLLSRPVPSRESAPLSFTVPSRREIILPLSRPVPPRQLFLRFTVPFSFSPPNRSKLFRPVTILRQ